MFRKLILTAALSAAALVGVAATAEAHPVYRHHEYRARFEVMVRDCGRWQNRGVYRDREQAACAAQELRHHGFEVRVERI